MVEVLGGLVVNAGKQGGKFHRVKNTKKRHIDDSGKVKITVEQSTEFDFDEAMWMVMEAWAKAVQKQNLFTNKLRKMARMF